MFEQQNHLNSNHISNSAGYGKLFYYASVIDINDPQGGKRIKARIKGVDDKLSDGELPWASSFIPLNIVTNPKKGEMVKILTPNITDLYNKREWIGPVFNTYEDLDFQSASTALSTQEVSGVQPKRRLNQPETAGAYVQEGEVAIQGRDNTDVVFKDKEVLIRAGKFVYNDKTKLNGVNPAYIKLKLDAQSDVSYGAMVADKILLISHNGHQGFNRIIEQKDLESIIENALSAAYAEPLIEFLKLMQDFVANHIHASNLPANKGRGSVPNIIEYDLDRILAKNIKIN